MRQCPGVVLPICVLALVLVGCRPSPETDKTPARGSDAGTEARNTGKVTRIGKIDALDGKAVVVHEDQRIAATAGYPVYAGDRLETGADGKVQVTLVDNSVVAIGAGTTIELSSLLLEGTTRRGRVNVTIGKFWMRVTKWKRGESSYEVATPNAVAGVRGTTLWGDTGVDAICSLDGTVEVSSLKDATLTPATLTAGNCASALSKGKLEPLAPTKEAIDGYLKEVLIKSAPR